jgi:two-component system cell cycle response regulator DivK
MCDILVVENNEHFRRTLHESLAGGFPDVRIEAVKTGEEAIAHCADHFPRLLFLDIGLPGMNGFQTMEIIRSKNSDVRIVVVTGNDAPEYREAAGLRGADYFVSKNAARLKEILALAGVLIGQWEPADDVPEKFEISSRP